jgi:hypothetical protein
MVLCEDKELIHVELFLLHGILYGMLVIGWLMPLLLQVIERFIIVLDVIKYWCAKYF